MAEEDFELDLYGDDGCDGGEEQYGNDEPPPAANDEAPHGKVNGADELSVDDTLVMADGQGNEKAEQDNLESSPQAIDGADATTKADDTQDHHQEANVKTEQETSTPSLPTQSTDSQSRQTPLQQGVKRKEGHDDRAVEHGASTAITISELNWWNTDDDVRGWASKEDCEAELKDITFSEHKVNGKSKGQAYVEFESPQAATAVKKHIEQLASASPGTIKYTVVFASPATNPFRTLPRNDSNRNTTNTGPRGNMNNQNSMRGNRGGRGGVNNMNSGNYNNRGGGFQGNSMGPMQGGSFGGSSGQMGHGGFGGAPNQMGGFQNNFGNRGGMMNNMRGGGGPMPGRGGRGGFNGMPNMMGGMNMMGNSMGNMASQMGNMVNQMGNQMSGQYNAMAMNGMGGFGGQGHFNPAFFQGGGGAGQMGGGQQMGSGGDWNNPHGAKRPRGE